MNFVSLPMYVNFAHFFLSASCFCCFFLCLIFSKMKGSYLLLINICCIIPFSFRISVGDSLYVFILLCK